MLYLIHGSDTLKTRKEANKLASSLLSKRPNSNIFKLNEENFSTEKIEEFSESSGLFESKYIVIIDGILSGLKDNKEVLIDFLPRLSESENVFIVLDKELPASTLKKIEKFSKQIWVFQKEVGENKFNVFALSDAVGNRDKKRAWEILIKAREAGIPNEELYGIIFWQLKSMGIQNEFSLEDCGEKPFVYNKAKRFANNFKEGEVRDKLLELLDIYHLARRGGVDFEDSLERFVLGI